MKKKVVLALTDKEVDKLIKISGTQYDRRRKLDDKQIALARKMFINQGRSLEYIANKFGVHPSTIRYHLDKTYRRYRIDHANYGDVAACKKGYREALAERANYKRQLVARGGVDF